MNTKKERNNMDTNREVSIQTKVDENTWHELKEEAKRRGYKFSAYIRRLLISSLEREKE